MHWESTRTSLKTEAIALLERRREEARAGKVPFKNRPLTLREFSSEYLESIQHLLEYQRRKKRVEKLCDRFGNMKLGEFTTRLVEQYMASRSEKGYANATVNRELQVIQHMIKKANDWNLVSDEVLKQVRKVKKLPEYNERLRYLSEEEEERLLAACSDSLRPIVIFALDTGMRRGEIFDTKWDDVDLANSVIYVKRSGKGQRAIPIPERSKRALEALPRHISSAYVFWHGDGRPWKTVKESFNKALRKAKIRDFHFHDFRHTYASRLAMGGIHPKTMRDVLGHRTSRMVDRYTHPSPEEKTRIVEVLNSGRSGQLVDNLREKRG